MKISRRNVMEFRGGDAALNDPDQKTHTYEIHPRKERSLLYLEVREAVAYAKFYSRSQDATIRGYDAAGNVTETHQHSGDIKE